MDKRMIAFLFLGLLMVAGVSASSVISPDKFQSYHVISQTGDEQIFNVNINGNNICLSPKSLTNLTYKEIIDGTEIIKSVILKSTMSLTDYQTKLKIADISYSNNQFCAVIKDFTPYLKIGNNSIVLAGDTSYNSTDNNITQETGFSHLSVSNSTVGGTNTTVLYMDFNINTTTPYDNSPFNNNAVTNGTVMWFKGWKDQSGTYNYTQGNAFRINDSNTLHIVDNFTIGVTFKRERDSGYDGIFSKMKFTSATNVVGWSIDFDDIANNFYLNTACNNAVTTINASSIGTNDLNENTIIVRSNNKNVSMWINGVQQAKSFVNTICDSGQDVYLGRFYSNVNDHYLNGYIKRAFVDNRSWTDQDIIDDSLNKTISFKPSGTQIFQGINLGNNNTANVSIPNWSQYGGAYLQVAFNNGSFVNFTNGNVTNYSLSGMNSTNLNLTILHFSSKNNNTLQYSSILIGNITIDASNIAQGDISPPNVTHLRPIAGESYNINDNILVAANVTDGTKVNQVWANISIPNGTLKQLQLVNTTNTNYTGTYIGTGVSGQYNITFQTNDTLGYSNNTQTTYFIVTDSQNPSVTNVLPVNGTGYVTNFPVVISAVVTDNVAVSSVVANVSFPNTTLYTFTLSYNGSAYNMTIMNTSEIGNYSFRIIATDSSGNVNSSETSMFIIEELTPNITIEDYGLEWIALNWT